MRQYELLTIHIFTLAEFTNVLICFTESLGYR